VSSLKKRLITGHWLLATDKMQIQLEKTLDVEVVERQLAELWKQTGGDREADNEAAVLRARVANLLVFVRSQVKLDEAQQVMPELTAIHPSRVLLMFGDRDAEDRDIEMSVTSYCHADKRTGAKRLCCEEVTSNARGKFVVELPSVALPLLVPDLATFLWWRNSLRLSDKVFDTLVQAADRLVIDSAEFDDPLLDLLEINSLFADSQSSEVGISDLNWARLTLWRGLLADFYDVPAYQQWLERIDFVGVDYVGPEPVPETVAPQAFLIAGWLASRLGWTLADTQAINEKAGTTLFNFRCADRTIKLELNRVKTDQHKPGRLVQVKLRSDDAEQASFVVTRSEDNLHVLSEAKLGEHTHRGRVLPVRNRSAAHLLSREMEILCNDQIYQEALAVAAKLIACFSD
jgi:glucose-6-phosphate dehydrogenase assembly protein OpcA